MAIKRLKFSEKKNKTKTFYLKIKLCLLWLFLTTAEIRSCPRPAWGKFNKAINMSGNIPQTWEKKISFTIKPFFSKSKTQCVTGILLITKLHFTNETNAQYAMFWNTIQLSFMQLNTWQLIMCLKTHPKDLDKVTRDQTQPYNFTVAMPGTNNINHTIFSVFIGSVTWPSLCSFLLTITCRRVCAKQLS